MTDKEQRDIFSKNLRHYLYINQKSQKEVADAISVSTQTFNTWCQGIAIPRMGKMEALANYFGIKKTDLIEDKDHTLENKYDIENARLLNEIKNNASVREFIKTFLKLSDANKKVVIAMVYTMYEANKNET